MKWYDDEVINNQDHKHIDMQERPKSGSITTSTVIPQLTKIIRSRITFVSRNVISRRFL